VHILKHLKAAESEAEGKMVENDIYNNQGRVYFSKIDVNGNVLIDK
jgi:hypothetical protein